MSDEFRLLHVRRCSRCGVDTPHETTRRTYFPRNGRATEIRRCLACGAETRREESDAPQD